MALTTDECTAASGEYNALVDLLNGYLDENDCYPQGWLTWGIGASGYPELVPHVHDLSGDYIQGTDGNAGKHAQKCSSCGAEVYVDCVYDQKVEAEEYLLSPATCVSYALYYKSCVCGACDTANADIFYYSEQPLSSHGNWMYSADGNVLTAKCGNDNCTAPTASASLYLTATDKAFDGYPATATISDTAAWIALLGNDSVPTIKYYDSTGKALDAAPVNAGTYTAKITAGEAQNERTASAAFTIHPKSVSIPVPASTAFLYDGVEKTFMSIPDDAKLAETSGNGSGTNAGEYTVILELRDKVNTRWSDGTTDDQTYTFTILPATLVIRAENKNAIVGDPIPDFSAPVKGNDYTILQGGDAAENDVDNECLSISLTASPNMAAAGSYDIVPTVSGSAAGNYTFIPVNGALTVSPPDTVPIPAGAAYTYNGEEQILMTLPEGIVYDSNATTASFDASTGNFTGTDAGEYKVVLKLKDEKAQWSDGTTDDKAYTFVIEKAALIVKASNKTADVGSTAPDFSNPVEGKDYTFLTAPVSGTDVTVTLSCIDLNMNAAGSYAIRPAVSGDDAANYTITAVDGTLTVAAAPEPAPAPAPASDPLIVVPASGDESTVNLKVNVEGKNVIVNSGSAADINNIIDRNVETGVVNLDLSGLGNDIIGASIPTGMIDRIADAMKESGNDVTDLNVRLPDADVKFDAAATQQISGQANGSTVNLVVEKIESASLNTAQQAALADRNSRVILDAYLTSDGSRLCTEEVGGFNGGSAEITLTNDGYAVGSNGRFRTF